jgi:putative ABC transport system permease protein
VPYSLVTGVDLRALPAHGDSAKPVPDAGGPGPAPASGRPPPDAASIVLNEWAARELNASVGNGLEVEYYLWDAAAGLRTATARFTVSGIVPIAGLAADRRLAPVYPGITAANSLADWDPPFPLDLSRVRPQDEAYWDEYRTTPKAFVAYERARELWSTRYGALTSLRVAVPAAEPPERVREAFRAALRERVRPSSEGLALVPARRLALEASTGATNFGEYFTYFSFFIVVSAVILAMLFFRLGVEGRLRQVGILRAAGFPTALITRMLLAEGALLALAGSVLGIAGAVGYAHLIVYALETWWVGAVGTTLLEVHVETVSLLVGAAGGTLAALAAIWLSLRAVAARTPRGLMGAQSLEDGSGVDDRRSRRNRRFGGAAAVLGLAMLAVGFVLPDFQAAAFFGAGAALLTAILFFLAAWLRARDRRPLTGRGPWAVSRLGFRSAAFRPGRSVMSAALVAAAAFIIVSVDAFRRGGSELSNDPRSGSGGYALLAQSDVPLVHNPNEAAGREALVMQAPELDEVRFSRFRLRPGEDASCLNLYRPSNPTLVAPESSFIDSGRFAFADSLAETDDERRNPWLLLRRTFEDGTVPAIADATSLQYVLHLSLGDTMTIDVGAAEPLVLRFVGALRDSVLQGQIVIGEEHFVRRFPGQEGYRFFLIESPGATTREQAAALAEIVERELEPFGLDAVVTSDRLDAFHRVENTYLSTFQALGGLGLLLGTVGLATVMFRNVLERRRELALLRAVGYDGRHVTIMVVAETMFLVACGLAAGVGCAIIAVAPAWLGREGSAPGIGFVLLLAGVLAAGLLSALAATRAAVSGQLLGALRAE